jgi:hypothetical protein
LVVDGVIAAVVDGVIAVGGRWCYSSCGRWCYSSWWSMVLWCIQYVCTIIMVADGVIAASSMVIHYATTGVIVTMVV